MKEYTFIADFHTHTLASDHAYSTVTEMAQAAAECGLAAFGCTDHGVAMSDAPHPWHFGNLKDLPDFIHGVRLLRGVEANVMDFEGKLDMEEWLLKSLEVVVASMHGGLMPAGTVEQNTAAWLGVAVNPYVDIIGHSGSPEYAYDYEAVIPVFGENGKAVELNEHSFTVRKASIRNCRRIIELCRRYEVPIAVDSDAHYHPAVGRFPNSIRLLRELDFPPELIVNAGLPQMNRFFARKGLRFSAPDV